MKVTVSVALPIRDKQSGVSPHYVEVASLDHDPGFRPNDLVTVEGMEIGGKRYTFGTLVQDIQKRIVVSSRGATAETFVGLAALDKLILAEIGEAYLGQTAGKFEEAKLARSAAASAGGKVESHVSASADLLKKVASSLP